MIYFASLHASLNSTVSSGQINSTVSSGQIGLHVSGTIG